MQGLHGAALPGVGDESAVQHNEHPPAQAICDHANGHDHSFASAANSPSPADHGHENGHDHSFALLSQYLAGGFHGQVDHGQIAMAASHAGSWLNESILTRPQH